MPGELSTEKGLAQPGVFLVVGDLVEGEDGEMELVVDKTEKGEDEDV